MFKISHRGKPYLENTMLSFKTYFIDCIKNKKNYCIELDLHKSNDNQILIIHDTTLDRTTSGFGEINKFTLAQIKQYKIKENNILFDESIPSLYEFLQWLNFIDNTLEKLALHSTIILDIKMSDDFNIISNIIQLLNNYTFCRIKIIIGIWNTKWINYIKNNSDFKIMLISDNYKLISELSVFDIDNIDIFSLDINLFKKFKSYRKMNKLLYNIKLQKNITLITWTINTKFEYCLSYLIGASAIITDNP